MAGKRDTPAMRQYAAFKKRHPDCVLFFRMGDFYEMFDDDARLVHRVLGLALTERTEGIPMAGVPHHQLDAYLRRMIDAGHRVAVCDQVQDAAEAKGVVERAVTRVVTPGTLVDETLLEEGESPHLAAVGFFGSGDDPAGPAAASVVELSTGAFHLFDCPAGELAGELAAWGVREALFAQTASGETPERVRRVLDAAGVSGTPRPGWHFRPDEAFEALCGHYRVATLAGFGLEEDDPSIGPAGAMVRYLAETQAVAEDPGRAADGERRVVGRIVDGRLIGAATLRHLSAPKRHDPSARLRIDAASLRALEVERTVRSEQTQGTLAGVFSGPDAPATGMGKRLLREWLKRPLVDLEAIAARHAAVEALTVDPLLEGSLCESVGKVQDVARIAARLGLGRATPRDLVALGASVGRAGAIASVLEGSSALGPQREALVGLAAELGPIAEKIGATCVDRPPVHLREGGLVRDGVDAELDEARSLQRDANSWLAEYQGRLVAEHDLPSLKVGFNKVFGYYIELPAAQAKRAPEGFSRKQTLKNAERYITPELKGFEEKVLRAGDVAAGREQRIFAELCAEASGHVAAAGRYAAVVAELDVLGALARRAVRKGWVRPTMTEEPVLDVVQGRHPVLEEILGEGFVPNDCALGCGAGGGAGADDASARARLALITGPNMAGKSTFIRQTALIVLLAHAGSFVPAESAVIGRTDRIFTRIGADDALHRGMSTFMVEMIETANILHHATARSLVILDEIGRGTSTLDGLSLAWAIAEDLACGSAGTGERDGSGDARGNRTGDRRGNGSGDARGTWGGTGGGDGGGPRALFATHYHELTDLAEKLPGRVKNLHVSVKEWGEEIVFLHRILPGRTNRSYGIHVAKLAGLPSSVVSRAGAVLESLAVSHGGTGGAGTSAGAAGGGSAAKRSPGGESSNGAGQLGLFTEYVPHPVLEEIKRIELERLSPMEAFDALRGIVAGVRESEKTSSEKRT